MISARDLFDNLLINQDIKLYILGACFLRLKKKYKLAINSLDMHENNNDNNNMIKLIIKPLVSCVYKAKYG